MNQQLNNIGHKGHHDPKVMSKWNGAWFVIGIGVGFAFGYPIYGAAISIPLGAALGWIKSKRSF